MSNARTSVDTTLLRDVEVNEYAAITAESPGPSLGATVLIGILTWVALVPFGGALLLVTAGRTGAPGVAGALAGILLLAVAVGHPVIIVIWFRDRHRRATEQRRLKMEAFLKRIGYSHRSSRGSGSDARDDRSERAQRWAWYNEGGTSRGQLGPEDYRRARELGMSAETYVANVLEDDRD